VEKVGLLMQSKVLCKVIEGGLVFMGFLFNLLCIISEDYLESESQESSFLYLLIKDFTTSDNGRSIFYYVTASI